MPADQRLLADPPDAAAGCGRGGDARSGNAVSIMVILSGDRPEAVAPIAAALGIGNWHAGLTPVEKIAVIDS